MTLTVLGSSGSYPGPGRACSGYLVRSDATTIWLDAGPGTLANLQRHVDLHDIDAVVLTHKHPDHCRDIEGYYVACRYYRPRDAFPVYAPRDVPATLAYNDAPFDWQIVADGAEAAVGNCRMRFAATDHTVETLSVRVDGGGKSLGYSADAGPRWSFASLGSGIDLGLCEATVPKEHEGESHGHMSARQAGAMAKEAGVRRLVLTHLSPLTDPDVSRTEAAQAFGSAVELAVENESYEL
jgi:ribonuclease BN (tRNA processing enzyme)